MPTFHCRRHESYQTLQVTAGNIWAKQTTSAIVLYDDSTISRHDQLYPRFGSVAQVYIATTVSEGLNGSGYP